MAAAYLAIGVYLCAVVVAGFLGNVLVIVAFCKYKKLRTANNCLILNLSASDLTVAVVGTPMSCSSSFAGRWLFGQAGCSYYGFINYYCGCISLNTFAVISVYRYITILRHQPNRRTTLKTIVKVIAAVHAVTLVCTTPPLFGWNEFILEGFKTQCDINYRDKSPLFVSYIAFMFVALFFAPLGVIVHCYWRIFTFLRRRTQEQVSQSVSLQLRSSARIMERRTTYMMLVCLAFFLLAWSPYCVVSLWSIFGDHRDLTPAVSAAPALVAKSCIVFNPIIYAVMSPQYRRSFQELFRVRRTHRRESSETTQAAITRLPGNSSAGPPVASLPSNAEPKMSSQDNDTPDINANEDDVPDQTANQVSALSDVGRYRRSRMKRSSKLSRSASTSSADNNSSRASLSTCSSSSTGGSSDRSCISLDSVDVKSLRAIAFARNSSSLPRSRSETRFGPKARTRLYKRSLRHQSSDSVVVIGGMHQENKMLRSPSDAAMSTASSVELMAAPKPKMGPHPKKKMLRSHSESAIDVTMLRTAKNNMQDSSGNVIPQKGIVCSNEDLMKILSDARKQKVTRRRNNTIVCRLDATPELPQEQVSTGEAETCLNEDINELTPLPKISPSGPTITSNSPRSWSTRHHSMRIANHTTEDLKTCAMDLHDWSPKHALINSQSSSSNANFPAKMFSRGEKRSSNGFCRNWSYPTTTAQCPTELEPMLGETESDQDDNGNIVEIEEEVEAVVPVIQTRSPEKSAPSPVATPEAESQPSTSTSTAPQTIVCTGFDPELLGQAIERHLTIAKVSPTHESKPERSRSNSIKSMWTQNRISNLVTRFPFRRENSTTAAV